MRFMCLTMSLEKREVESIPERRPPKEQRDAEKAEERRERR